MVELSDYQAVSRREISYLPAAWLCMGALVACVLLGGNTVTFSSSDAMAEALCVPAFVAGVAGMFVALRAQPTPVELKVALLFCVLAAALPLVQLVPLPPGVWTHLPGRAPIAEGYRLAGIEPPWLGLSLSPAATRQSLFSLGPALAIFLLTVQMNWRERRAALGVLIALALLSAVVGLLQLGQGAGSPLRFYYADNTDIAGFFANHNHLGVLFYLSMMVSGVWGLSLLIEVAFGYARRSRDNTTVAVAAGALFLAAAILLLGAVLTRSRAVILLGAGAAALVLALTVPFAGPGRMRTPAAIVAIILILALAVGVNLTAFDLMARLQQGLSDSIRADIGRATRHLIGAYFPIGSGFGTFLRVYAAAETPSISQVAPVNRAHDDYLEWMVEGSVAAGVLTAVGVGWVIWMCVRSIRSDQGENFLNGALQRAAAFGLLLTLVHSTVEYPLRTIALMGVAALFAGMCVEPFGARADIAPRSVEKPARRRRRKKR